VCDLVAGSERQMILEMDPCWILYAVMRSARKLVSSAAETIFTGRVTTNAIGLTLGGICCADHGRHRHGGGVQIGVTPGAAAVHQAALATRRRRVCGDEASQGGEASLLWRFGHGMSTGLAMVRPL
jgi:hypothetical protein